MLVSLVLLCTLLDLVAGTIRWEEIKNRLDQVGPNLWEIVPVVVQNDPLFVSFSAFGRDREMSFEQDHLLVGSDFKHVTISDKGVVDESDSVIKKTCVWKHESNLGYVSRANTCGGSLSIFWEDGDAKLVLYSIDKEYAFVYKSNVNIDKDWSCSTNESMHHHHHHHDRHLNAIEGNRHLEHIYGGERVKYIKLLIVSDYKRFLEHGSNIHAVNTELVQNVQTIYDNFNKLSEFQIKFQIVGMITFSHGDPWDIGESTAAEVSASKLLNLFSNWRSNQLQTHNIPANSLAYLLSGHNLEGTIVGLANLRTICSDAAGSGIVQTMGFTTQVAATIFSHEVAHNLGARHTSDSNPSTLVKSPCLEGSYIMDSSGIRNSQWSTCTKDWVKMSFEGYPAGCAAQGRSSCEVYPTYGTIFNACAEKKSSTVWTLEPTCGNGIKEAGEECDCGDNCVTIDPCCDGATCKLKPQATCSALDDCCDPLTCNVISASVQKVCRESNHDTCDVPETCDGLASVCPANTVVPTGTKCDTVAGAGCYAGECLSHSEQCGRYGLQACTGWQYYRGDESCSTLYCENANSCLPISTGEGTVAVSDGTVCQNEGNDNPFLRMVCMANKCVNSTRLKPPSTLYCSNGVWDQELGETDVDCGGSCFPCLAKEQCLEHNDCFGVSDQPSYCETGKLFDEPPVGSTCSSFRDVDTCDQYSSCIWLGNLCKTVGLLPDSGTCTTQDSMESCENYRYCGWVNQSSCASQLPESYGKCRSYDGSDISDPETGPLTSFLNNVENNLVLVVSVGVVAVLFSCCLVFYIMKTYCKPIEQKQTSRETPNQSAGVAHLESLNSCPLCRIHFSNPSNEGGLCNNCHSSVYILTQDDDESSRNRHSLSIA